MVNFTKKIIEHSFHIIKCNDISLNVVAAYMRRKQACIFEVSVNSVLL